MTRIFTIHLALLVCAQLLTFQVVGQSTPDLFQPKKEMWVSLGTGISSLSINRRAALRDMMSDLYFPVGKDLPTRKNPTYLELEVGKMLSARQGLRFDFCFNPVNRTTYQRYYTLYVESPSIWEEIFVGILTLGLGEASPKKSGISLTPTYVETSREFALNYLIYPFKTHEVMFYGGPVALHLKQDLSFEEILHHSTSNTLHLLGKVGFIWTGESKKFSTVAVKVEMVKNLSSIPQLQFSRTLPSESPDITIEYNDSEAHYELGSTNLPLFYVRAGIQLQLGR